MSKVQSPKSLSELQPSTSRRDECPEKRGRVPDANVFQRPSTFSLTAVDLRKSFLLPGGQRLEVLKGASFSAKAGECVAVTGASGAGKSTLLHLLGGLEKLDHGSITAGQFSIESAVAGELVRFRNREVGFVFQFHHLLSDLSAIENVILPLRIKRVSRREAARQGYEILKNVGITRNAADSLVTHLSGGEQQRVAVCRALITRPSLVLADEPTGNLDDASAAQIARLLLSYVRSRDAILVIATHSLAVSHLCDRELELREGRLQEVSG